MTELQPQRRMTLFGDGRIGRPSVEIPENAIEVNTEYTEIPGKKAKYKAEVFYLEPIEEE